MKKILLTILVSLCFYSSAWACTYETINTITENIEADYSTAAMQLEQSLRTLNLCDENLYYAGNSIGSKFDPSYQNSTYRMSEVIIKYSTSMNSDLIRGLGIALIKGLELDYGNSSIYMLRSVLALGKAAPIHSKEFALNLLKVQDPDYANANNQLLATVEQLQQTIQNNPEPVPGSYWSFRSQNESCDFISGPWGQYELCPRYFASVSDNRGNRIVLSCKSENAGIEFRFSVGNSLWSQIASKTIQSLGFAVNGSAQSLGIPYVIARDQTLLAEEVLAPEMLDKLRTGKNLSISLRANSGEFSQQLPFTLQGSNKAITRLLQVCH